MAKNPLPFFPAVDTSAGKVQGTIRRGPADTSAVSAFLGIPYAAPPVGQLRWRPPRALAPWSGIRSASRFGPDCWQEPRVESLARSLSEDCLYLNIWAPADAAPRSLPVMVWLHGGSFESGSGAEPSCDGAALARLGAVVVTLNYRLGIFGFLAHPSLTAESAEGTSGNYGLLDQLAALAWIRDNIAGFGGDPARVTVFGVSAGAAAISLFLTAPLADGLFQQAILQSPGTARALSSLGEAESAGLSLSADLDALRKRSARDVLAMTPLLVPEVRGLTTPRPLRPIRDGWLVREDERAALKGHGPRPMPIILGTNADEGTRLTQDWPVRSLEQYREFLRANFPGREEAFGALYPAETDDEVAARVAELFADTQFNYGIRLLARTMSARERRTWRYLFTRRHPGQKDGPHHTDEVPYVFGSLDVSAQRGGNAYDATDHAVSALMMKSWVAFAASGDCAGAWPPYTTESERYLEIGDPTVPSHGWRGRMLDEIEDYYSIRDDSPQTPASIPGRP